ncbi:phage terminase large subunit [Comamonas terrigena]|uniref:phage terminase large subunit n=1 Tax=Comamonas terrigena TaxID=32013 RepID=UPI00244B6D25|nr:phage terminase large subunit [Comamonas terrigena]MDH0048592.1 phage terminase large subunit [Comamonas terrigena]MDH0511572.1 phage terminase large subunit [Comamonas terrigena]MDH1090969.1 phage terminase large subunit [Comamonas terrigena]
MAVDALEVRNLREFEAELAKLGEELRNTIELECEAFDTDPQASRERRERAWNDYEYFCRTYFPHYVPTPYFSLFQQFIFKRLPEIVDGPTDGREVHMAPRGEAKSTYETQLGTLWCIVTGRKHMVGIIMNTEEQSAEMLESIKAELDTNPRLAMDFPEACGRGRVWQATTIVTANNRKVRIGGTGKKIRGMKHGPHRPDLIWLDDLENDDNVRDKSQRDKVEKYVLSAVIGLAGPGGGMDVFWVGTSLHYDAAINRVSRKPGWRRKVFRSIMAWPDRMDLWEKWEGIYTSGSDDEGDKEAAELAARAFYEQHQALMDAGAVVSWPDVRPLYRLMCMRATDHDAFSQEQQNEAGNDDTAPFKTLQFWVDKRSDWLHFGSIDPSLGKQGKKRDPSAILVGGLNRNTMVLDVVEADICRRVPDLIISRAIELQAEYQCLAWGVETVQFQEFMYTELLKRAALMGMAFPGVAMPENVEKELRIISLQPHVANGKIRLHRSQTVLVEQLKFWPEADHDDGPDALEKLWRLANQFGGEWSYTSAATTRGRSGHVSSGFEDWDDDD